MAATPAGWYQDPHDPNQERYWDGSMWTTKYRPKVRDDEPSAASTARAIDAGPIRPALLWTHSNKLVESGSSITAMGTFVFLVGLVATVLLMIAVGDAQSNSDAWTTDGNDGGLASYIAAVAVGAPVVISGIVLHGFGQLMRVVGLYTRWRVADTLGTDLPIV